MEYKLLRSKNRWRSASLQVTREGEIVVRAPYLMPRFMIDQFVDKHLRWIEKRRTIHRQPKITPVKYFPDKSSLQEFINSQVNKYSQVLSLYPKALKYKSVKTYWGSCSPTGVISFNLHLQFAPPEAVEYVVVHELCHLKWRGHGKRFWDLVTRTYPATNDVKRILRHISRD